MIIRHCNGMAVGVIGSFSWSVIVRALLTTAHGDCISCTHGQVIEGIREIANTFSSAGCRRETAADTLYHWDIRTNAENELVVELYYYDTHHRLCNMSGFGGLVR